MIELLKDYSIAFIGFIVLLISFLKDIKEKKSSSYLAFILILCLVSLALGIDKINRDNKKEEASKLRTKSLHEDINKLKKINEGIKKENSEFLFRLQEQFHIVKDTSNHPRLEKIFFTNIRDAETVNIGND